MICLLYIAILEHIKLCANKWLIINYSWIELPWPENPANTYARHTETLGSCFDLLRSHQQCINQCPGYLAAQLPWFVNLASLVYDMNCWLSCRVSALQSVVAGWISSGGDHGIHCWWDLIRSKQLSSVSVRRCSPDFLAMVIQFAI